MTQPLQRSKGLLFIALGCLAWLLTAYNALTTRDFVRSATRTEGVVRAWGVGGSAHPEIEFVLPSGEKVSFTVGTYVSQNLGERVPVLYLPANPGRSARVADFGHLWQPLAMPLLAGFGLLAVGAWTLLNQPPARG